MNWRFKAHLQNLLASLPPRLSNTAYYVLQRKLGNLRRITPIKHFNNAIRLIDMLDRANLSLEGATILELGTGRTINMPIAFWLCGADKIVTVDLNPYLSNELVMESLLYMREHTAEIKELFGTQAFNGVFKERFCKLVDSQVCDVSSLLSLCCIDYHAPVDASETNLTSGSIDYYCSSNVIEHIPPSFLGRIFTEARRVLRPTGFMMHYIDMRDHFYTADPALTMVNFLQFSEREWQRIAGNRFMYQNRMRGFDYKRFFDDIGFNPLLIEEETDADSLQAIKRGIKLDRRFHDYSAEELAVVAMGVIGKFK